MKAHVIFLFPEKVQVQHILIGFKDRSEAAARDRAVQLRKKLLANPDGFRDAALEHSEDEFARRGGDIGFLSREGKPGVDPKIVEVAFELPVYGLSEVFRTDEGFHLVRVANRRERVERSFDEMKGAVLRHLKTERSKGIQDGYIQGLKRGAKIQRHADQLEQYTPRLQPKPAPAPADLERLRSPHASDPG